MLGRPASAASAPSSMMRAEVLNERVRAVGRKHEAAMPCLALAWSVAGSGLRKRIALRRAGRRNCACMQHLAAGVTARWSARARTHAHMQAWGQLGVHACVRAVRVPRCGRFFLSFFVFLRMFGAHLPTGHRAAPRCLGAWLDDSHPNSQAPRCLWQCLVLADHHFVGGGGTHPVCLIRPIFPLGFFHTWGTPQVERDWHTLLATSPAPQRLRAGRCPQLPLPANVRGAAAAAAKAACSTVRLRLRLPSVSCELLPVFASVCARTACAGGSAARAAQH